MKIGSPIVVSLVLGALSGCALPRATSPERLSIEFGQGRYLSDTYLATTPGSRCGHPSFAPGGVEARAPLPDGSWFRVFAVGAAPGEFSTVVLQRGVGAEEAQLTMRLDAQEGIVRLDEPGRKDAWGINHSWADWLRDLGRRVQNLDCAAER
jgi:hypothetical protein